MRWLILLAGILVACSGSGREGLNGDSRGEADGIVGKVDVKGEVAAPDVTPGVDVVDGGLVDVGCVDCVDVPLVDVGPDVAPDIDSDLPMAPIGCCHTTDDCPPGTGGETVFCAGQQTAPDGLGVCVGPAESGWCYVDEHCEPGQECHGSAVCGCNIDCDPPYLGPGICVPEGPACAPIEENWVKEICNAASVVIWDGEKCIATCPGCCGCEPFCELTFESVNECQAQCGLVPDCPLFVGALAEEPYVYKQAQGGCIEQEGMAGPCKSDDNCPGGYPDGTDAGDYCVLGNCVFCWNDSQCPEPQLCRAGRCVNDDPGDGVCPPVVCEAESCSLITPSEQPCPVCVCNSVYGRACSVDEECKVISSHPYAACVNGRCADCRNDDDCPSIWSPGGETCVTPGICYEMTPPAHFLYGTWLIGWAGGMDHFSYFRFEPDGTLRRGHYIPEGSFTDDIPPLDCYYEPNEGDWPILGTWEPEVTQSGFLVVKLRLDVDCNWSDGFEARWMFTPDDDWLDATVIDIDGDNQFTAMRVPTEACAPDMWLCDFPLEYMPW
jgi:hypothetical protein